MFLNLKSFVIALSILLILQAEITAQKDYTKNAHVSFNVSTSLKDYVISYTFNDQWNKPRQVTLSYPKAISDSMINKFGVPKSLFDNYVVNAKTIKERERIISDGLFKSINDTICVNKSALIEFYSYTFCKPIAQEIRNFLVKDSTDTRLQRIEMALKFVQDIPYAVPIENQEKFKGGVLSPPEVLLNMYGDCDSKSILFIGIIMYLIEPQDIAIVKENDHQLVAIKGNPIPSQKFIRIGNSSYIIAEPTGPARLLFGSTELNGMKELIVEWLDIKPNYFTNNHVPSYIVNEEIDELLYSNFVKKKPTTFLGEPYLKASDNSYHIKIKNDYHSVIYLAIHICNIEDKWETKGWYKIKPGEIAYIEDTKNRYFYIYAESFKKTWEGNFQMTLNLQRLYGKEVYIPNQNFSDHIIIMN